MDRVLCIIMSISRVSECVCVCVCVLGRKDRLVEKPGGKK